MGNSGSVEKKWVIGGIAGAAIAVIVLIACDQNMRSKNQVESSHPQPNILKYEQSLINRVTQEIRENALYKTPLSLQTLTIIYFDGFKLAERQYAELQIQNRLERRAVINNPQQYVQSFEKGYMTFEKAQFQRQLEVCAKLGVTEELFKNSVDSHMQNQSGFQEVMLITAQLQQQQIVSIQSQKEVRGSDIDQIIAIQNDKLNDLEYFRKYIQGYQLKQFVLAQLLVNALLNDITYELLGFEEEDIMKGLKKNTEKLNAYGDIQEKVYQQLIQMFKK